MPHQVQVPTAGTKLAVKVTDLDSVSSWAVRPRPRGMKPARLTAALRHYEVETRQVWALSADGETATAAAYPEGRRRGGC
jgi:hypothetical protein